MTAGLARRPALVVATGNPGKAAEFRRLLAGLECEVRSLHEYPGVALPPEVTTGYAENARRKACAAARATGTIALGDDSGLEVDALGGRPGPGSARYGGPGLTDAERVTRLLAELEGAASRRARFRCALALAAPWGEEALVEGLVEGTIATAPRGAGGFGYDPVFVPAGAARTFGEMSQGDKDRLSHRARAVARARPILDRWLPQARVQ